MFWGQTDIETCSDSPTVWWWLWSLAVISMCSEISFCMIYPNLYQTKINVCCTFNFYLISTSWCRCFRNHYHGHSYWKQGKVFGSKVIFVHITKVYSIIDALEMSLSWQPLQCLSWHRKISSSLASPWKGTTCLCCGQDWCKMKMLTHCCLFLVCSFRSAWLSPS